MNTIAFNLEPKRMRRKSGKLREEIILVECKGGGDIPHNASIEAIERVAEDLKEQLGPLSKLGRLIHNSLSDTMTDIHNPAKIEVQFGLELRAEAGLLKILSGSAAANFKVTLTWEKKRLELKTGKPHQT